MKKPLLTPTKIALFLLAILAILNLAFFIKAALPALRQQNPPAQPALLTTAKTPLPTPDAYPDSKSQVADDAGFPVFNLPTASAPELDQKGIIVMALQDGNYSHLFVFHPQYLPLTRLTNDAWDDITPAVSPDGSRLAFSSRRGGSWDIYILNLADKSLTQVTQTTEYDAAPTWSPDGQWLAYESYVDDNLEILVKSLADLSQPALRLTNQSGPDYSPAWSPQGREIAFISARNGKEEVWLASLDQSDNRFTNASNDGDSRASNPSWSPDGKYLAWAVEKSSVSTLVVWERQNTAARPLPTGSGSWPVWNPAGDGLLTEIRSANQTSLQGYSLAQGLLLFPPIQLPGDLLGLDWKNGPFTEQIQSFSLAADATAPAASLWTAAQSLNPPPPGGRSGVVPLQDVTAPYAFLDDRVDESFNALRQEVAQETGWDFLSSLENAYTPPTQPPTPEQEENWLETGRAIAVNPAPLYAGWMAIVKEDINGQTFWQVYLKARKQDGSQGRPLRQSPWDINARYAGNPQAYENGGQLGQPPSGYWVNFTAIARRYGWERLPSLTDWRSFYPSIRFNQFVLRQGVDWYTAMT
ncbi:MAG: hypothetical protein GYA59_10270, partial [Chloroflexi bacterium]|nr:hypothetical protein [Chloroflexota bacterium]